MPYQLTVNDYILRLDDNAIIPPDPGNIDYKAYLAWVANGDTPEPFDTPETEALPT
jgi:hypothetical protein